MTETIMPGLAQLIETHKKKSDVILSIIGNHSDESDEACVAEQPCPELEDAIGQLRPDELRKESLPEAIAELKEIRLVTEQSVDTIMGRAEDLMEHETSMDGAISILEACAFQDLVGQRVSKISELLESLEERFHGLVHETGIADRFDGLGEEELEAERRRKELILHGPQLTGDGVSQDEIDALLGA